MNVRTFEHFLDDSRKVLKGKTSDSEKVRVFINWCIQNEQEELILRLSSERKGGWAENYFLDFTTSRIIITKKKFLTKIVDIGYVAGLAPYPYILLKNQDASKIRKDTSSLTPERLIKDGDFASVAWYSDIEEIVLRKGMDTIVANMFGRAIVSNFLTVKARPWGNAAHISKRSTYNLPVNKNGTYEQIHFWLSTVLPPACRPRYDVGS